MNIDLSKYNEIREVAKNLNTVCFCYNFKSVSRLISKYYSFMLVSIGINSNQFNTLIALMNARGAAIMNTELAKMLHMDRTTVSRNLDRLRDWKLLAWVDQDGGDKRRNAKFYTLTDKGMKCVIDGIPLWKMGQKRVNEVIEDAEKNARNGEHPIAIARIRLIIEGITKLLDERRQYEFRKGA